MKKQDTAYSKICRYLEARRIFINEAEQATVRSVTRHRIIPKHTVIMEQGKPVESLYFLNAGIVRLYRIHNNVDYTLGLISSNDFISTPLYLANGVPSTCALETLTDVDLLEWNKADMQTLKQEFHQGYELELSIMDRLLSWLQSLQIDAICLSAEERYLKLIEEQPEVIRAVPLKYIASFLCIHQDSLSRIRKMIRPKG
ncbi:Crp/Fnr family transcriptional regulator [Chitinophaga pinensis]|uniref:Transcriptional regulator, Crp/Fnr family n=1 Tax=Chitinophaga pinensis (strain ATCC 43595 / DSM 2588 / LMG 13176 / NBRC 15968 / NCIMB 11800 / UQM 2034) TaxID=485918 RepID=A0A979G760_CHIPD|nr:Crp/Fnr family transcriptional regulator [Chitinophaga pinensis]ACU62129.1 putative transcriptional regulator, Crp/Fnr family [Chitinophaga pinensis DSM 2588]